MVTEPIEFTGRMVTGRQDREWTFTATVEGDVMLIQRQTCDEKFVFPIAVVRDLVEKAEARGL